MSVSGIDASVGCVGSVLCAADAPIPMLTRLRASIVVFEPVVPLTKGYNVVFHTQQLVRPATLRKLIEVTDKKTGDVLKTKPRCLTMNQSATVEIAFEQAICIDLFSSSKTMGRFMLRYGGNTIAAGMVTHLL